MIAPAYAEESALPREVTQQPAHCGNVTRRGGKLGGARVEVSLE
jgi:hypothetical protein